MSEKETACLRDITETDIMEYMQVEHPHNEKELWKMKHATPARIGDRTVRRTLHDRGAAPVSGGTCGGKRRGVQ